MRSAGGGRRGCLFGVADDIGIEITSASNQLFALIRNLPARQAQVVALHYWEQCSVAEIAEILGISAGTVKTCLHRGRATLAERLRADTEPHHTSASGAQP